MLPQGDVFDCAAHSSILSAAHAANILISYSCRSGQCGSCRGRILAGQVDYPDGFPDALSARESEAGFALFCSARALSDLTIELAPPSPQGDFTEPRD